MCDGNCAQSHDGIGDAGVPACRVGVRVGSDELRNFGAGRGVPSPGFFVSVASKGDEVEQNQQLQKC